MRKLMLTVALLFVGSVTVYAQPFPPPFPPPFPLPTFCCQHGETFGATSPSELPYCEEYNILEFGACTSAGGRVVSGTCHTDGNCGGATTCCEGVSMYESCFTFLGSSTATPNSCAPATEDACDALSPAGEQATESVPGGTCTESPAAGTPACTVPEAPPS